MIIILLGVLFDQFLPIENIFIITKANFKKVRVDAEIGMV